MYQYRCQVTKVIDGDTIEAVVDLGFRVKITERFRLLGIDTPEITGLEKEAGLKAKEWLVNYLAQYDYKCMIDSTKGDKYGRWLAVIFVATESISVNDIMVNEGIAIKSTG